MTNPLQQGPSNDPDTGFDTPDGGHFDYPKPLSQLQYTDAVTALAALVCVLHEERPEVLPALFPGTHELIDLLVTLINEGPNA